MRNRNINHSSGDIEPLHWQKKVIHVRIGTTEYTEKNFLYLRVRKYEIKTNIEPLFHLKLLKVMDIWLTGKIEDRYLFIGTLLRF